MMPKPKPPPKTRPKDCRIMYIQFKIAYDDVEYLVTCLSNGEVTVRSASGVPSGGIATTSKQYLHPAIEPFSHISAEYALQSYLRQVAENERVAQSIRDKHAAKTKAPPKLLPKAKAAAKARPARRA